MNDLAVLRELPDDVEVERGTRGVLAMRRAHAAGLRRAGFGPDGGGDLVPSELAGRAPLSELVLDGEPFVVRHFRHGGLLRGLTGERYADPERPFRELVLSDFLARAGVSTPEVAAARAVRLPGFGWRLELVTRRVDDALDLAAFLELVRGGQVGYEVRAAVFRAAGALVGRLHRHAFLHADLHPRNLLLARSALAGDDPRLWVLDLDRSRRLEVLGDEERRDNLRRLARSVLRRDARGPRFLTRGDAARFLAAYGRRLVPQGPGWRVDWAAIAARHARRSLLHRLGWALEESLGGRGGGGGDPPAARRG